MDDINRMLSGDVQGYYGNQYQSYQKEIVDNNPLLHNDKEKITEFIANASIRGDLLDIGAGNCQWFSAFEPTIHRYLALEANEVALSHCPENSKLHKILGNGFDLDFPFSNQFGTEIQTVLFSFFLSHFSDSTIVALLKKIRFVESILIIDSYWGDIHKIKYKTKGLHIIERKMSKHSSIELPKRFFDENDLHQFLNEIEFTVHDFYRGHYWFGCLAKNNAVHG